MRISSLREFRDNAADTIGGKDAVLVTRRGRLAGIFIPLPEANVPAGLRREIFGVLGAEIARKIRRAGLKEEKILADFALWKRTKRRSGVASKTSRTIGAKSRPTKAGMSKLEAKRSESFKELMKKYAGRLRFAGCDE
jgi:hypothetical protein